MRYWWTCNVQQKHGVNPNRYTHTHIITRITNCTDLSPRLGIIMSAYRCQEEMEDADISMEEEPSLSSSPVSEAELDRLAGVLDELHHLLETAPHCMVQPPGKAFPTTARITGPQERDDPYPTLYR